MKDFTRVCEEGIMLADAGVGMMDVGSVCPCWRCGNEDFASS